MQIGLLGISSKFKNLADFGPCNIWIVSIYSDKVLRTVRQLYSAQRLDLRSFYVIVCSALSALEGRIEICSDIIAWAEKQESDEATTIYWLAHDCLAELMK